MLTDKGNPCRGYLLIISQLMDGEASPGDEAALRAHMAHCPGCERVYKAFRGISEAMPENLAQPPEGLASGVMCKINMQEEAPEKKEDTPVKKRKSYVLHYLAAAACLVLIVAGALRTGLFGLAGSGGNSDAAPEAVRELYNGDDTGIQEQSEADKQLIPGGQDEGSNATSGSPEGSGNEDRQESAPPFIELTGLLNADYESNEQFLEDEMVRLASAAGITVYEGAYIQGEAAFSDKAPLASSQDAGNKEKLLTFMDAETMLSQEDSGSDELDPIYTIIFHDTNTGGSLEDITVTIWNYDNYLIFRLSSQPPILYRSDAFPNDFMDFIKSLNNTNLN